jgi:hypothetical protein
MNRALKVVIVRVVVVVLAPAVVWVLFEFVFPWVDRNLIADPTLDAAPAVWQLHAPATT